MQRRFRVLTRASYLDVDPTSLTVVIPRIFGGRGSWVVPMSQVSLMDTDHRHYRDGDDASGHTALDGLRGGGVWLARDGLRTPYLTTSSPLAAPNLCLLFAVPQTDPPDPVVRRGRPRHRPARKPARRGRRCGRGRAARGPRKDDPGATDRHSRHHHRCRHGRPRHRVTDDLRYGVAWAAVLALSLLVERVARR